MGKTGQKVSVIIFYEETQCGEYVYKNCWSLISVKLLGMGMCTFRVFVYRCNSGRTSIATHNGGKMTNVQFLYRSY